MFQRLVLFITIIFILQACHRSQENQPSASNNWVIADELYHGRNYQSALEVYSVLKDSAQIIEDWERFYLARTQMAFCLWRTYRSADAYALADSIAREVSHKFNAEHELIAKVYTIMGNVHCDRRTKQDYDQSVHYFKKALAIYEHHYSPPSTILALAWERLGIAQFLMKDYATAIPFYQKALSLLDEPAKENKDAYVKILNNLGLQFTGLGDHWRAIRNYKKARFILAEFKEVEDARMAVSLTDQSVSELALGDWSAALISLEQAWEIEKKHGEENSVTRPFILEQMGHCYSYRKNWNKARHFYKQFMLYWDENDVDHRNALISAWNDIGNCFLGENNLNQAQKWFLKADSMAQIAYGRQHINRIKSILKLQQIAQENGHLNEASKLLSIAFSITSTQFGKHHSLLAKVYYNKAKLANKQQQYQNVLKFCKESQQALKLDSALAESMLNSTDPQLFLETEYLKAQVYVSQKKYQVAYQHFRQTLLLTDTLWQKLETPASRRFIQQQLPALAEQSLAALYQLWQQSSDVYYFEQAVWFANQCRSKKLRHERRLRKWNAHLADSTFQKGRALQREIQFYEQLLRETTTHFDSFPASLWRQQLNKRHQIYKIWKSEKEGVDWLNLGDLPTKVYGYNEISSWSKKNEANLLIFSSGKQLIHRLAFVNNQIYWDTLSYQQREKELLKQWKNQLYHAPDLWATDQEKLTTWDAFITTGWELYQKLIPIQLSETSNALIIMPDGDLHALPFDVLLKKMPDKEKLLNYRNLPYLFKQYPIRYAYTLEDVIGVEKIKQQATYLAVAPANWSANNSPLFNTADSLRLLPFKNELTQIPSLPFTQKEVESGQNVFNGKIYLKEEATEKNISKQVSNADILHFSTHTWIHPTDPDYSALILQSDSQSDGWLFSRELESWRLSANLVILSSCYTGSGINIPGEGISSMGRMFLSTGCARVLISNWALNDRSNTEIITEFLKKNKRKYFC